MTAAATIYVIDDDTGLRTAYAAALSRLGYQVEVAADGVQGLQLLKTKGKPALIVLDLFMPNLDGFEFLKQFRADTGNDQVKVVIVSNFELMPEVSKLGVSQYISKTNKGPDEVAAMVDHLIKVT
jgi:CheY-like chemotaxis protein